jgi:hypothetical protein
MGKKNRKDRDGDRRKANGRADNVVANPDGIPVGDKPRILFFVGDADYGYSEAKIWCLAKRLEDQLGWNIVAVTHDPDTAQEAFNLRLKTDVLTIESPGVSVADRLRATDEMIRETADVNIPGSRLPLWKVMAMDDFLSSLHLYRAQPKVDLHADAIIVPMMAIDNNTRPTCGLYTWAVAEARRKQIPVIGLEVSPLGNKNTMSHLPADYYAVKNAWSKKFLQQQGIAHGEQISVLKWEEAYLLWPGRDEYTDAFLEHEATARGMLNIPDGHRIILLPHHVAFIWEVRQILRALTQLPFPFSVVIRVDPRTVRRQFYERELVTEAYPQEIRALPHVVIDERVGIGLLLQLADLVIAPFAGTTTERAALCHKPTIMCQAMGHEGWQGEDQYWEPRPERLPEIINDWKAQGRLDRVSLSQLVRNVAQRQGQATRKEVA